jgi:hypothetical protein
MPGSEIPLEDSPSVYLLHSIALSFQDNGILSIDFQRKQSLVLEVVKVSLLHHDCILFRLKVTFEYLYHLRSCLDKFVVFELDEGISKLPPSVEKFFESFNS